MHEQTPSVHRPEIVLNLKKYFKNILDNHSYTHMNSPVSLGSQQFSIGIASDCTVLNGRCFRHENSRALVPARHCVWMKTVIMSWLLQTLEARMRLNKMCGYCHCIWRKQHQLLVGMEILANAQERKEWSGMRFWPKQQRITSMDEIEYSERSFSSKYC